MTRAVRGLARWLAAGVAAALVACALGAALRTPPAAAAPAHAEALARWRARTFADYELVVQEDNCTYDVRVRRGHVTSGRFDLCSRQARPVDALFQIVERDREVTPACGPRGCLCETLTRVRADYDPQLGYPTTIAIAAETRTRWESPDVWRELLASGSLPRCAAASRRTLSILVEPLQR